jgi:hypothetical protein
MPASHSCNSMLLQEGEDAYSVAATTLSRMKLMSMNHCSRIKEAAGRSPYVARAELQAPRAIPGEKAFSTIHDVERVSTDLKSHM